MSSQAFVAIDGGLDLRIMRRQRRIELFRYADGGHGVHMHAEESPRMVVRDAGHEGTERGMCCQLLMEPIQIRLFRIRLQLADEDAEGNWDLRHRWPIS